MVSLKPASTLAQQFGVKAIVYGPPGKGKTPLVATAPSPVLFVSEPGTLTLRDLSHVPAVECFTPQQFDDAMRWLTTSAEAKQFSTVWIDSISQCAENEVERCLKDPKGKDGRAAYGMLSQRMMAHINTLYYTREKNVVLLAKQTRLDENGIPKRAPYFPGQDLNTKVPHLFDEILHLDDADVPQVGRVRALRTVGTIDLTARDRSGRLAEYEAPNMTQVFNKIIGA